MTLESVCTGRGHSHTHTHTMEFNAPFLVFFCWNLGTDFFVFFI